MICDAHMRWNFIRLDCVLLADHAGPHEGLHHSSVVTWEEGDRRNYHGDDPGPCKLVGCVLPDRHRGAHES